MRLSCALAAGALAVAAVPSCAFHVRGPAFVPASSTKTSFASTTPVVGRHAASFAPAAARRDVLRASLNVPGSDWVRGRAERVKSALVLKSASDAAAPAAGAPAKEATSTLKVGFYLFVWYVLTIGYNIYNKATLNRMNIPWILSTVQLAVGTVYVSLIWALGVRKAPKLSGDNLKAVLPLAFLHTTSHIAAVVGLSAGAIGFVQIVKVRRRKPAEIAQAGRPRLAREERTAAAEQQLWHIYNSKHPRRRFIFLRFAPNFFRVVSFAGHATRRAAGASRRLARGVCCQVFFALLAACNPSAPLNPSTKFQVALGLLLFLLFCLFIVCHARRAIDAITRAGLRAKSLLAVFAAVFRIRHRLPCYLA